MLARLLILAALACPAIAAYAQEPQGAPGQPPTAASSSRVPRAGGEPGSRLRTPLGLGRPDQRDRDQERFLGRRLEPGPTTSTTVCWRDTSGTGSWASGRWRCSSRWGAAGGRPWRFGVDGATQSRGDRFLAWLRPLHYGEALGAPWRVAVCLAGAARLLLLITGVRHWRRKRQSTAIRTARLRERGVAS